MTPKQAVFCITVIALVALGAHAVTADAPVPDIAPDWSAVEWTGAGDPLPAVSGDLEALRAGHLAYLWAFDGNVGTYVDGCTTIELLPGPDVRVVKNCIAANLAPGVPVSQVADACIRAQVLLGTAAFPQVADAAKVCEAEQ